MSIWGPGVAENDDAADWLDEFLDEPSITALNDAFDDVIGQPAGEYLEVTEGANAVVAAQVVSEIFLNPGEQALLDAEEDEEAIAQLKKALKKLHPGSRLHLVERAMQALTLVAYNEDHSELQELMHEHEPTQVLWRQTIFDLERRLQQSKDSLGAALDK